MNDETLIYFGGEVKALSDNRVGGYLVVFGDEANTDASAMKDFFTSETDFGRHLKSGSDLIYHHDLPMIGGQPNPLAGRVLGDAEMKVDDVGVWLEGQMKLRDKYEQGVMDMVKAGKLGLSSGTAAHRVRRAKCENGAHKIVSWPLGLDASLTPTPAEPRTMAVSLKSLFSDETSASAPVADAPPPSIVDRSERLVADAAELKALFAKALSQRRAEGRGLSQAKWEALKSLADELADLCRAAEPRVDPRIVAELHNRFLLGSLEAGAV